MKPYPILLGLFLFIIFSCEEVIDVDLQEPETRLVVNGIVRVDANQEFLPIAIKVTESSGFFGDNTITELESAVILAGLRDSLDATQFQLGRSQLREYIPGTGIYEPDTIGNDVDDRIRTASISAETIFFLIVEHKGRRYAGQTMYVPTVPIDEIRQGNETLFDEDDTEIEVKFTDLADQQNFYVFDFGFGNFLAVDDQFIDGQQFQFSYFYDEDLASGQELEVSILGADQQFFNYMDLLVEQTENDGGVFETPAATVRGNMFDVTGLDNIEIFDNVGRPQSFALGYFAVVEENKTSLIIE
ncbi:DUF4249 family protein [Croceivirga thetidis]|uniref:DUF4249 domain-containing protein n=1 Tax=Croceivirga thetidis TaxID=2721623 RepID=A0ABX1GUB5_9FLAO|nr:DUF4249 family protein [Croceivirga thetidis]NKI32590.1 DUF4249 domain-containing protein [Croceivirga thetidis]